MGFRERKKHTFTFASFWIPGKAAIAPAFVGIGFIDAVFIRGAHILAVGGTLSSDTMIFG